jgi:hypothetical protein
LFVKRGNNLSLLTLINVVAVNNSPVMCILNSHTPNPELFASFQTADIYSATRNTNKELITQKTRTVSFKATA